MSTHPTASALQRRLDEVQLRFQVHFADHVRLTRDLASLDRLLAEGAQIEAEARDAALAAPDQDWPRLQAALERRIDVWNEARGAIAQAHAAAGLRDREASLITGRARLVLHRYVRHFAGKSRRTRDPLRLAEMVADLRALWRQLEPLLPRLQVPSVVEEVRAVGGFIGFFEAEQEELRVAWGAGSRLEQSDALAEVLATAQADWDALVVKTPRHLRRLGLLDRLVGTMDVTLETLMAVRHANMPEVHEERVAHAARLLVSWQEERDATLAVQTELHAPLPEIRGVGKALYAQWREMTAVDKLRRDRGALAVLCDRTEEVEALLTARLGDVPDEELTWLRDVLVAMERSYDAVVAVQSQNAGA